MSRLAYHYTIADRLIKILNSGYLKLCPERPEPNETRYVWLTTNHEWDRTAFFGYPLDLLDSQGRIRITVDLDCINPAKVHVADEVYNTIHNYDGLVKSAARVKVQSSDWIVVDEVTKLVSIVNIEVWNTKTKQWNKIKCLDWSNVK